MSPTGRRDPDRRARRSLRLAALLLAAAALLAAAIGGRGGVEGRLASSVENAGNTFEAAADFGPSGGGG